MINNCTIGIITPASPPKNASQIQDSMSGLRKLGFKVKLSRYASKRHGFLAGSDEQRVADINAMFKDPQVDVVLALRGGYGSSRLLPLLDKSVFQQNKKAFIGYSDVTALHGYFLKNKVKNIYHGPGAILFSIKEDRSYSIQSFLKALRKEGGSICADYKKRKKTVEVIRRGKVKAPLMGGNLTVLASLLGTKFFPNLNGSILLLEEVNESPYKIDRLLTQLINSGALSKISGIALGTLIGCEDLSGIKNEYRQTAYDVIIEKFKEIKVPFVMGLPIGHGEFNATVPLGVPVLLDCSQSGDLVIL